MGNPRYYAGYYHYGYRNTSYDRTGVAGHIYTINPYVGVGNNLLEWVTVVLKYYPTYWVQIGYIKGAYSNYELHYYYEKKNVNGYSGLKILSSGPAEGTWHSYAIRRAYPPGSPNNLWRLYIDGVEIVAFKMDPYYSDDEEAFIELYYAYSGTNIDGSHFKGLGIYFLIPQDRLLGSNMLRKPIHLLR